MEGRGGVLKIIIIDPARADMCSAFCGQESTDTCRNGTFERRKPFFRTRGSVIKPFVGRSGRYWSRPLSEDPGTDRIRCRGHESGPHLFKHTAGSWK